MPLHLLHLLQPLDFSYFAVLKQFYEQHIEEYMRASFNYIDKPDFFTAYVSARKESIAVNTVRSSFAATSLVPFDLERVFSRLNTYVRTPTPPADISFT
jgi:hypothetical protein